MEATRHGAMDPPSASDSGEVTSVRSISNQDSRVRHVSQCTIRSRNGFPAPLSPGVEPDNPSERSRLNSPTSLGPGDALIPLEEPNQDAPAFPTQLAVVQGDWWKRQMLVDRSLRVMAGLTVVFALVLLAVCLYHLKPFLNRLNKNSTSVGWGDGDDCATVENKNIVRLPIPESHLSYSQNLLHP